MAVGGVRRTYVSGSRIKAINSFVMEENWISLILINTVTQMEIKQFVLCGFLLDSMLLDLIMSTRPSIFNENVHI